MPTDTEVLQAVKDLTLTPVLKLGYNAADDLIRVRKIISGTTYELVITDPDVTDNIVDRWVEYAGWNVV